MYVEHFTQKFYNKMTSLYTGNLGAVLRSGGTQINEARYYDPKSSTANNPSATLLNPRGYASKVYIKASAISCGGCETIRKYASFTCPMPPPKG